MNGRFSVKLWVVIVFLSLAAALVSGCSTTKPNKFLGFDVPPVDIHNNVTGAGTVLAPQPDGVPDIEFTNAVENIKNTMNGATGGLGSPWFEIVAKIVGFGALGLATYNKWKGDKDHAASVVAAEENKKEIQMTDVNVATVAAHVGVPETKLI